MKLRTLRGAVGRVAVLFLVTSAVAQNAELISINSSGAATGNGISGFAGGVDVGVTTSADGRFVAFVSEASDLTTDPDTNGASDVFLRDRLTGTTTLLSINSAGTASGNGSSFWPVISDNGRFVVFTSAASDLTSVSDTNGTFDVFVRDTCFGAGVCTPSTKAVSINSAGTATGNGTSLSSFTQIKTGMSADGTRIVFESVATDLVPGFVDGNGGSAQDLYLRDLSLGTTTLVSVNATGTASCNGGAFSGSITPDGQLVAFASGATDLVPGFVDGNGSTFPAFDVFVRDLAAGTTTLVSINAAGTASGNGGSFRPRISANGDRVAFVSNATDLVSGLADANATGDVFVRDLSAGTTTLVSINSAGTGTGNGGSGNQSISNDGSRVAFSSFATDLDPLDSTNIVSDIYLRDLSGGTTTLISINSAGTAAGNGTSSLTTAAGISGDGSRVLFESSASDLVPTPGVSTTNVYVRDVAAGTTTLISISSDSLSRGNGTSSFSTMSTDSTLVAFESVATNLVTVTDSNSTGDVFAFALPPPVVPSISIDDVSVTEGDAGTVNLNFTVSLSAPSAATITVDFITNGVTATSGTDFVANSGTVTFAPSDVSEPVTITINGDTKDEFDETLTVDLSNPTNATIADAQGVGTILDNDPAPTLSINDVSQAEGNAGTTNLVFTVSLSAVSGKDVSVNYLTADNSATQPSDYTLTSGTLNILAGSASGPISVPIVGDATAESNETFFVNLSVPVNATILDGQGQGTITDDDSGPPFTMTSSASTINCTAGATAQFSVTIAPTSPPLNTPVTFSCSGNPPQSTCTVTPGSVTPGNSPATVQVQIQTSASSALLPLPWERERLSFYAVMLFPGLGLVGLVMVTPARGKKPVRRLLEVALLLGASLALLTSGCGGGGTGAPGTPSGAYTVTITGTSSSGSNSTTISLTIHQ